MKGYYELRVHHPKFYKHLSKVYKKLKKDKCTVLLLSGGPEVIRIDYETPRKEVRNNGC